MKYLIALLFIILSGAAFAQRFNDIQPTIEAAVQDWKIGDDQQVYLSEIVEVESGSQAELFRRAEGYITTAYNDAKTVTEAKSVEEGFILVKALMPVMVSYMGTMVELKFQHLLRIDTKEKKARIVLTMVNEGSAGIAAKWNTYYPFEPPKKTKPTSYEKTQGRQFYAVDAAARATLEGLRAALTAPVVGAGSDDDW